ncbi:MAG: gamma-glutamyltransferase [Deltaproteobacteria bacterium]|jgi:gamma-glutamyltranspeptidase/glutathione hydrolase|nr:gamma-glutamyltransferase [Deltaproteobacteria bacterium]
MRSTRFPAKSRWLLALISLASIGGLAMAGDDGGSRYTGKTFASRSPVLGSNGMVATSQPLASTVALDVLKRGGSAIDAAIAANAMLGLVEPSACGIGGDLFAIVWDPKTQRLHGYNGSGRSPRGLSYADLVEQLGGKGPIQPFTPLAVSVPGAVDGWYALHERFGRLPMAELLAPAIRYARAGYPVSQVEASDWAEAIAFILETDDPANAFENLKKTYLVNGRAPKTAEIFRNEDLARSYEMIAKGGRDAFYRGDIAKTIAAYLERMGGFVDAEDLARHRGEWVDPVSVTYRGYRVFELPPNGQGIAALQILNLIEAYDLAAMGRANPDFWHLLVEAKKLAYEDRARFYADPDFSAAPVQALLSKEYASERRKRIEMSRAAQQLPAGEPAEHGDTTYISTADADGMMVSLIQSTYWEFGSGLVPDELGFPLQNRGVSFNLEKEHANVYAPGKRPFHTIIPAFVLKDGKPVFSFGVMGGFVQPQGHVQILVNLIDFGMNVQEAGDAARFVHSGSSQPTGEVMRDGGILRLEAGVPAEVAEALRARGHSVIHGEQPFVGGYQGIWRDPANGVYHGASEMRFDGAAMGY